MLAVGAAALGVGPSLAHVVDSVSGVDRKPTPILLLPVDGRVATAALRPDDVVEESWLSSSTSAGTRRGGSSGRRPATTSGAEDDASYRYRRQRNNEAARRSREKRRRQDGVIRRQLEALVAENRELRCQLALFRRLLDEVAAAACHKDGDGALQPGSSLSSIASSVALSTASDRSRPRDDVTDESSVDDGEESALEDGGGDATGPSRWSEHGARVDTTDDAVDWQHQLTTPLNLCRRVASS